MKNVNILDYVAKDADVIYREENPRCGVAMTHMDGVFIVSRKFSTMCEPKHVCFETFAAAKALYEHIVNVVKI